MCVENYNPNIAGHLVIRPGDYIDIVSSTDCGFLEGYVCGTNRCGFFPANCVREVTQQTKSNNKDTVDAGIDVSSRSSGEGDTMTTMMMHNNAKQFRTLTSNNKRCSNSFGIIIVLVV